MLISSNTVSQAKSGKELVGFLFNDFLLLTQPEKTLGNIASVFSFDISANIMFKVYREVQPNMTLYIININNSVFMIKYVQFFFFTRKQKTSYCYNKMHYVYHCSVVTKLFIDTVLCIMYTITIWKLRFLRIFICAAYSANSSK